MKPKILIVEDDAILSKMYAKKCELSDFEVETAVNGEDGLTKALSIHPDIILLDIMMPKVDGITMMDELRKDPWGEKVPIIILTNLDVNDVIIQKVIVDLPSYYMLKSTATPEEIISKATSLINNSAL